MLPGALPFIGVRYWGPTFLGEWSFTGVRHWSQIRPNGFPLRILQEEHSLGFTDCHSLRQWSWVAGLGNWMYISSDAYLSAVFLWGGYYLVALLNVLLCVDFLITWLRCQPIVLQEYMPTPSNWSNGKRDQPLFYFRANAICLEIICIKGRVFSAIYRYLYHTFSTQFSIRTGTATLQRPSDSQSLVEEHNTIILTHSPRRSSKYYPRLAIFILFSLKKTEA